jgi:hypothetical protein
VEKVDREGKRRIPETLALKGFVYLHRCIVLCVVLENFSEEIEKIKVRVREITCRLQSKLGLATRILGGDRDLLYVGVHDQLLTCGRRTAKRIDRLFGGRRK